jgi:hypothetical protein
VPGIMGKKKASRARVQVLEEGGTDLAREKRSRSTQGQGQQLRIFVSEKGETQSSLETMLVTGATAVRDRRRSTVWKANAACMEVRSESQSDPAARRD